MNVCCIYVQKVAKKLMERGIPAVPKVYFYVGDVRDVAQAHIKAMTVPEAAGKTSADVMPFDFKC